MSALRCPGRPAFFRGERRTRSSAAVLRSTCACDVQRIPPENLDCTADGIAVHRGLARGVHLRKARQCGADKQGAPGRRVRGGGDVPRRPTLTEPRRQCLRRRKRQPCRRGGCPRSSRRHPPQAPCPARALRPPPLHPPPRRPPGAPAPPPRPHPPAPATRLPQLREAAAGMDSSTQSSHLREKSFLKGALLLRVQGVVQRTELTK